jgi:hypothetical protein
MTYSHRNRCGHVYWLQRAKTRTGKPRHYFGRKVTREPVEEVPAGFEAYESPRFGQVYLRKKLLTCIDPEEREIVAHGISLFSEVSCGGPNYRRTFGRIKTVGICLPIWRVDRIVGNSGEAEADGPLGSWWAMRAVAHVTPTARRRSV